MIQNNKIKKILRAFVDMLQLPLFFTNFFQALKHVSENWIWMLIFLYLRFIDIVGRKTCKTLWYLCNNSISWWPNTDKEEKFFWLKSGPVLGSFYHGCVASWFSYCSSRNNFEKYKYYRFLSLIIENENCKIAESLNIFWIGVSD